jgi:chitin synthase
VSTENQTKVRAELPPEERVAWIWCLFFAFIFPEIMTFLRASRMCFFKKVIKPTILQFCVVATAETLRTIGTGFLVFMILPNIDVVKGVMLTNCLCFVPGLIGKTTFHY